MICYRCDNEAGKDAYCPSCGADLRLFQKAVRMSNVYYNDALEKARVRNLSGAITSLQTSLRFYKYNIDARNLLGLIYYEIGDSVDALSEWVISRSYQYSGNRAGHYLNLVQKNKAVLSNIDSTVKKYNQALYYCEEGSLDLAFIQLKKVLTLNPKMVKAHQLMALLYIEQEKYDQAKKSLRLAGRIDTNNTLTLRYLHEVNQALMKNSNREKQKADDDLISYQSGNETIIMPKRFRESNLGASLVYIILGLILGIAAAVLLISPETESKALNTAQQQLVAANQSLTASNQTITSLQEQIEQLQEELDTSTGEEDETQQQAESYEALLNAYIAYEAQEAVTAGEALAKVNTDLLSDDAKSVYVSIQEEVETAYLAALYESGTSAYTGADYETAIADLTVVTDTDMGYEDGAAAFYLAESYRAQEDMDSAGTLYEYVISNYPDSGYAESAQEYISDTSDEDTYDSEGE